MNKYLKKIACLTALVAIGMWFSSCEKDPENIIDEHEFVDLGLPSGLKWASCNIGANEPYEYGSYYAWGEISTKSSYYSNNSQTNGKNMGDVSGDPSYDAARANWGGSWRMPTMGEMEELLDKCIWQWTTQSGICGYKVTGPNGNSIFFPAAGECNDAEGTSLHLVGKNGYYWTSTPDESSTRDARGLNFGSNFYRVGRDDRYFGRTVRPVSK